MQEPKSINLPNVCVGEVSRKDIRKFVSFCDRLCFFNLCSLFVCIPFAIAGVEISFAAALIAYLIKKILSRDTTLPLSKIVLCFMALFLLSGGISFLRSEYTYLAFRGYIRWWKACFLLIIAAETLKDQKRLNFFFKLLLVMLGVASLDGLVQLWIGHDFLRWQEAVDEFFGSKIRAGFGHYNNYSAYLSALLPSAILILSDKRFLGLLWRIAAGAIVVCGSVALWFSGSRSGMIALIISSAVLILFFRRASFLIYLFSCGLILLIHTVSFNVHHQWGERRVSRITLSQQEKFDSTDADFRFEFPRDISNIITRGGSGRLGFWADSLELLKVRPFFGYGPNTYLQYAVSHKTYAHNSYIQIAVELGIFGLIAFLGLAGRLLYDIAYKLRLAVDASRKSLVLGLFSGLLSFLVHSIFDHDFYVLVLAALFWILMGAASASVGVFAQGKLNS